ncbi:30S ribosomal protein S4e [Halobellus salinus]|uniref:Small ribosomal subunit protein eS4 n=1 Tax=Halobellus salinus TaxID=931585 RepID=A0A830EIB5_9EURY|nr:30S ribosomal protein S4e [Halobellus salinus]GGJ13214.1 30S ribosomal protein S4e [Halobellus salinus]SMP15861.1 SSU ribosomal protein S4E [Halobellus salinus]
MTRHQKRLSAPNAWPVERKTATFTVKAGAGPHGEAGVPLVVLLRDVLGYVDSTKEARYALNEGSVLVNGAAVSDEQRPVGMFDILAFTERKEYYRVFPRTGGRLALTEIGADAAGSRLGKIVGKQYVAGGATQLTLHDGENIRLEGDVEYDTKDSLVVDNDTGEIVAHFPYEEGALVTAVDGSHSGDIGRIDEITVTAGSGDNTVTVDTDNGGFETIEEYVVVIDDQFVDDDASAAADDADDSADTDADDESAEGGDDE